MAKVDGPDQVRAYIFSQRLERAADFERQVVPLEEVDANPYS